MRARFAGGARVEVDALVAADGIHSLVRGELFGAERPRFTGCVAYRGLVPAERLRALPLEVTSQLWMGPGRHFVHYFVRNRRLVNFVAVVDRDAGRASRGPNAATSPPRWPPSTAGTRRCARSCTPPTSRSSGACSTVRRWSAGRWGG